VFTESVVDIVHLEEIQQAIKEDIYDKYKKHYLEKIGEGAKFEIVTKHGREDGEIIKFARQEKFLQSKIFKRNLVVPGSAASFPSPSTLHLYDLPSDLVDIFC